MKLETSRDAVPNGFTQITIYDETSGERVATVFSEEAATLFKAAPELLEALKEAEAVIRYAAQESAGRVKAEIVGGWLHHANKALAAIVKATE